MQIFKAKTGIYIIAPGYEKETKEQTSSNKKPRNHLDYRALSFRLLSHQDSNLDRQNQKLQCYHYTMRQSFVL